MHPHHSLCTLVDYWALRVEKAFTKGNPLGCLGSAVWRWWPPCMEAHCLFGGVQRVAYRWRVWLLLLGILEPTLLFLEPPYPYRLSLGPIRIPFLHVGASVGFQSGVRSDRFSHLRSSLWYIWLELDISLSTSKLPSCIVDRRSL